MYSRTVLPAILPPFVCTAAMKKIVTLFAKHDDIVGAELIVCACACGVVSGFFFLQSLYSIEQ
jgi:hypothetical protein